MICHRPVAAGKPARFALALAAACISLSGCSHRSDAPTVGTYRVVLDLPGGEAPFGLEVAREDGAYQLYLLNGSERAKSEA